MMVLYDGKFRTRNFFFKYDVRTRHYDLLHVSWAERERDRDRDRGERESDRETKREIQRERDTHREREREIFVQQ